MKNVSFLGRYRKCLGSEEKGDVGIRKEGWGRNEVGREGRGKGRIEKGGLKNYCMKGVGWPGREARKKVFQGRLKSGRPVFKGGL